METTIKINTDSITPEFIEGIKNLFPHTTVEIIIKPANETEYILSNPHYAKELEERIEAYENMNKKTKVKKTDRNLQTPGEPLPDEELAKIIKEAEKGPFNSLEEHNKKMNEWIQQQNSL
jgi:hypothetical protein